MSNLSGMDYFLFVTHTFFVFVLFCLGPAAQCQTCQVWTFRDAHIFLFVKSELRIGDRAQAPARNYHSSGTSIPNSSITFRLIERPGQNKRILAPGPRRPRLATSTPGSGTSTPSSGTSTQSSPPRPRAPPSSGTSMRSSRARGHSVDVPYGNEEESFCSGWTRGARLQALLA